ncbi:hypothetical protein ACFU3E_09890 [Streptomyces sp. NPDC057424]|uniref:hypothetical protein n=1 Tax=Streptomyces sp. NPDC057424 TaxID=3346127 RepID=UPI00369DB111
MGPNSTNQNNIEGGSSTLDHPTSTRLYTLAHNPAYRNAMTLKGTCSPTTSTTSSVPA